MNPIIVQTDLRSIFGAVRDQGKRPTCLAFAASDLHAAMRNRTVFEPLCVEYAFYHACVRQGGINRDAGVAVKPMLEALELVGQPYEPAWPYLPALPNDLGTYAPPTTTSQLFRRKGADVRITLTDVSIRLTNGLPLVLCILPSLQFHKANSTSVLVTATQDPMTGGAHAVIAAGWGQFGGQKAFLLRNSWGAKWGDQGYVWATEDYLSSRVVAVLTMEA